MAEPQRRPRRTATVLIWVLRVFLALVFVFVGWVKFPSDARSTWVHIFGLIGFGQWFRVFTGIVEVLGGALLLVPRATPIALLLLVPAMIGALLVHIFVMGVGRPTVSVVILTTGLLFLGWVSRSGAGRPTRPT